MKRSHRYFGAGLGLWFASLIVTMYCLVFFGQFTSANDRYDEYLKARQEVLDSVLVIKSRPTQPIPENVPVYLEGKPRSVVDANGSLVDRRFGLKITFADERSNTALYRKLYKVEGGRNLPAPEEMGLEALPAELYGVKLPPLHAMLFFGQPQANVELVGGPDLPDPLKGLQVELNPPTAYPGDYQEITLKQALGRRSGGDVRLEYEGIGEQSVGLLGAVKDGKLVPYTPPLEKFSKRNRELLVIPGYVAGSQLQDLVGMTFNPQKTLSHLLKEPENEQAAGGSYARLFYFSIIASLFGLGVAAFAKGRVVHKQEQAADELPEV